VKNHYPTEALTWSF